MSMIRAKHHLDEARASIAVAMDHVHKAEAADVDPEVAGEIYEKMRINLHVVDLYCIGLIASRQPDIDRETAAIDASREPSEECPLSERVDGKKHSWRFDGDDPYIECVYCGEYRDALNGHVYRPGRRG